MGWTYARKSADQSVAQFFKEELRGGDTRVLDCAVTDAGTAYLAIQRRPLAGDAHHRVHAMVCLIDAHSTEDDTADTTFGYKDIDERMGPFRYDCPARILDLLSPTDNANALAWRETCRQRLTKRPTA